MVWFVLTFIAGMGTTLAIQIISKKVQDKFFK